MTCRVWKGLASGLVLVLVAGVAAAEHHQGHAQEAQGAPPIKPEMAAMMEAWMKAGTPGAMHQKLAESVGTWQATVKSFLGPGEPMVSQATAKREMILDGRVLSERFEGSFMDTPFVGLGMTGYDNARQMFWSTWTDSMSTAPMISWGKWDEAENALVLEGSMTDPMSGQPMKVRGVSRQPEPGKEIFEMWEEHGGEMVKTMEITLVKQ